MAWRKILSDVDDTLVCSGGNYPAGVDKSYPHKAIYPGVLSFYRELDLGIEGEDTWDVDRVGNLVFLSARPHVYKSLSESRTFLKFQQIEGLRARPALLSGNLGSGTKYLLNDDTKALAITKYQSFKEYITLYPEYKSVFIGDNGQGDVIAAEYMFRDKDLLSAAGDMSLSRAYMHVVQPLNQTRVDDIKYRNPFQVNHQICYFSTYIDAAIDAYNHRLIRLTGLRRIMEESVKDFSKISKEQWDKVSITNSSKETADTKRELQIRELNRSIDSGNLILVRSGLSPVRKMTFRQIISKGQMVRTAYGYGVVQGHRQVDGIYVVAQPWDRTGERSPVIGYYPLSSITRVSDKTQTPLAVIPSASVHAQNNTSTSNSSSLLSFTRYKAMSASSFTLPKPFVRSSSLPIGAELQRQNSLDRMSVPSTASPIELTNTIVSSSPPESFPLGKQRATPPIDSSGHRSPTPYVIELDRISGRKHLTNTSSSPMIMSTPPRNPESGVPSPSSVNPTSTSRPRHDSLSFKPLLLGVAGNVAAEKIQQQVNANIIGSIAWTPYGRAYILEYRIKEATIVVRYLDWKAFGFLRKDSVVVMTEAGLTSRRQQQQRLEKEFHTREWERKLESEVIQVTPYSSDNSLHKLLETGK